MRNLMLAAIAALAPALSAQDFIHYKFDANCTSEVINYATGPQALASNGTLQTSSAQYTITITPQTDVRDAIAVGSTVEVRVLQQANGSLVAERIDVEDEDDDDNRGPGSGDDDNSGPGGGDDDNDDDRGGDNSGPGSGGSDNSGPGSGR